MVQLQVQRYFYYRATLWYSSLKKVWNDQIVFIWSLFIIMQQEEVLTRPLYYCILYRFGMFIACLAWLEDLNLLALAHFIHHNSLILLTTISSIEENSFTYISFWGFVLLYVTHSTAVLQGLALKLVTNVFFYLYFFLNLNFSSLLNFSTPFHFIFKIEVISISCYVCCDFH